MMRRKLFEDDIINIRRLSADENMNLRQIAKEFNVSRSTIYSVLAGKSYKEFYEEI